MKRFLYFLPGRSIATPRILAACGVLDRFTRGMGAGSGMMEFSTVAIDNGPMGAGCIVAVGSAIPQNPNDPHVWQQSANQKFWLAVEEKEFPPGPGELSRELSIEGYEIELADRQMWRVPLLRRWNEQRMQSVPNVPRAMAPVRDDSGGYRIIDQVRPEYRAVDALAAKVFDGFVEQRDGNLMDLLSTAASMLAVNYRIGLEETGMLSLFDSSCLLKLLGTAVDWPSFEAHREAMSITGLRYTPPTVEEPEPLEPQSIAQPVGAPAAAADAVEVQP